MIRHINRIKQYQHFMNSGVFLILVITFFLLLPTVSLAQDSDGDGIDDTQDNCTEISNPNQRDSNGDGFGNTCDADLDDNGSVSFADLNLFKSAFGTNDANADFDGNGSVSFADLNILKALFGKPPGPSAESNSTEYYVRPDGGNIQQCNGLANVAFSGNISNRECAVSHLFELLDPQTKEHIIQGGDIVNIMNNSDGTPAQYEMGRHAQYVSGDCDSSYNYECHIPSIPSGTAANPTIIRGQGWNQSCDTPPVLWGSGRASRVITLNASQHVELSCLTITDHLGCIGASGYPDSSLICDRSAPYDKPFADIGVYMVDASNILLKDIRIEGLGTGILSGRLGDVTLLRSHLYANFSAGWDGDIGTNSSSNSGAVSFIDSSINFNGCGLRYQPGSPEHRKPIACAKQDLGGYGDGIGTAETAGDWVFDNTQVMYNNSDGIDLLYHSLGGKITIKNSRIEGNAGNQVKVSGNSEIVNNIIIANCAWNTRTDASIGANGTVCRASGAPLSVNYALADDKAVILNNTVISEGDCILTGGSRTGIDATNQKKYIVNNIFYAVPDFAQPWENSCMYYTESPWAFYQAHNNILHMVKGYDNPCTQFNENIPNEVTANEGVCTIASDAFFDNQDISIPSNPHFQSVDLGIIHSNYYDNNLLEAQANKPYPVDASSPTVNTGYQGVIGGVAVPDYDYFGTRRANGVDIGAVEFEPSGD